MILCEDVLLAIVAIADRATQLVFKRTSKLFAFVPTAVKISMHVDHDPSHIAPAVTMRINDYHINAFWSNNYGLMFPCGGKYLYNSNDGMFCLLDKTDRILLILPNWIYWWIWEMACYPGVSRVIA